MPKTRQEQAEAVATDLYEMEDAVEKAFAAVARLNARLPEFRAAARLSHTTGQAIFEAGVEAMSASVALKGAAAKMHHELDDLRVALKLERVRAGSGTDKPPYDPKFWDPEREGSMRVKAPAEA